MMELLGKARTLNRLRAAINKNNPIPIRLAFLRRFARGVYLTKLFTFLKGGGGLTEIRNCFSELPNEPGMRTFYCNVEDF